ncbi:MAG: RHS repeat-associated core domain-containing protein, partial [Byssovorax sp.]
HHDPRIGSVTAVTDAGGVLEEAFYYEPFGQRTDAQGKPLASAPSEVRSGFTGHEHDDDLGLINMRGRMFDPVIRRFLSPDPHVTNPLLGQSYNRYSYVLDNPTNLIDPTGFDCIGQECSGYGSEYSSSGFESTYGNDYSGAFTRVEPSAPSGFSGSAVGGNGAGAPVQAAERQRLVSMPTGPSAPAGAISGPVVNAGTGGRHVYVDAGGGASVDVPPPVPFMTTLGNGVWNMKAIHAGDISPVGVVVSSVRSLYEGVVVPVKDWAIDMHGDGPHGDHSEAMAGAFGTVVLTAIMPGEGSVVEAAGPAATRELAQQIANVARFPMNFKRTITLLETEEGPTLVAGGATDLSATQIQLARQLGLTPAPPLPGVHAEQTAIAGAGTLGLTPTRGVTTVKICTKPPNCAGFIQEMGGRVIGNYNYEF